MNAPTRQIASATDADSAPLRILLVEDDEADARLLSEHIRSHPRIRCDIRHVSSFAEALAALEERGIAVILLDLGLPDTDGLHGVERLQSRHPDLPVVVLTGLHDDDLAAAAVEAGAQEYVIKGTMGSEVLVRTIRHAVERHRLQAAMVERTKEMAGLYAISRELHLDQSDEQMAARTAWHLMSAMQWPPMCRATVTIGDVTASAGARATTGPTLTADIEGDRGVRGGLEVGYVRELPFLLPHEQRLLDAAAETLAMWLDRRDATVALADSEERQRLLVAQLPGLVFTTDADLAITSYAGGQLADVGIQDDAMVGARLADLIEPASHPQAVELFRAALAGRSSVFEGGWQGRWWRNSVEPQRDPSGAIVGTVCLSIDITAEHDRQRELAETRARLQGLFDNATDAILLADDHGAFVDVNPTACDLTGYSRDELMRLHPWSFNPDGAPDRGQAMWKQFLSAGQMSAEMPLHRGDGSKVDVDFRAVANIVPGVHLSIMRDITARKRAERELATSEDRFRTMAEAAHDAIYRLRLHPEPAFDYLNPAVETISGFTLQDYSDNPFLYLERAHPDDVHLLDVDRLEHGGSLTATIRFRHADGHWIFLEDARSPILDDDGAVVGVQGVIRDVTARERTQRALREALEAEQRAAAQLRAASDLKSHLIQTVSHELRTPMTSIVGFAATLAQNGDRLTHQEMHSFHEILLRNARRLERLLTDLLDLEQAQQGRMRLNPRETDLTALATDVAAGLDMGGRRVVIGDTPAIARVDPVKIERIVSNLLLNVTKHTPPDTTVTVRCTVDQRHAVIIVADDGPGIPAALQDRIFDAFQQGPEMQGAPSPGTGIGLSIVQRFAALHGGTATASTTPGGGATFVVRLPVAVDTSTTTRSARAGRDTSSTMPDTPALRPRVPGGEASI